MAKGSFSSNTGTSLNLYAEWVSVPDKARNQSKVTLKLYRKHYALQIGATSGKTTVAGAKKAFSTGAISYYGSSMVSVLIAEQTVIVKHNSDGTKQVKLVAEWSPEVTYSGQYIDTITVSKTVTLDTISVEVPKITSKSASNITSTSARINARATHSTGIKRYEFVIGDKVIKTTNEYADFIGLTAKKEYIAKVRALANNGKYSAYTNVIFATTPIYVSSITAEDVQVDEGKYVALAYTISPTNATNKSVSVKSSDESVAYVSNGRIYGLAKGSCKITLTAKDGSRKSAVFVVSVKKPIEAVEVKSDVLNLSVGDTRNIDFEVVPRNADYTAVSFESSNSSAVSVDENGLLTALAVGSSIIIVSVDGVNTNLTVNVFDEFVFNDIDRLVVGDRWDYILCQQVQENLFYIADKLNTDYGYTIEALEYIDFSEGYSILPQNIKGIVNTIEANIDKVNAGIDWVSPSYIEAKVYDTTAPIRADLNRWIDFLQEIEYIIRKVKEKTVYIIYEEQILCLNTGEKILIESGEL